MWNWHKNIPSAPDRLTQLPPEQVTLLRTDFQRLEPLIPGVSHRLMSFIDQGEPANVLDEVAAFDGTSTALLLNVVTGRPPGYPTERQTFFEQLETDDVVLLLRLAEVYDAISRSEPRDLRLVGLPPEGKWLEVFLRELTQFTRTMWPADAGVQTKIHAGMLEAMLKANDQPTDLPVRAVLWVNTAQWRYDQNQNFMLTIPGFGGLLERHPQALRESLQQKDFRARVHALEYMGRAKISLAGIIADIVAAAVSPAKQVQEAATTLLRSQLPSCLPLLQDHATSGTNDERLRAVRILWKLSPGESRPFLEQRAREDKSPKIIETIQDWLALAGQNPAAAEAATPAAPPSVAPVEVLAPLPPGFLPALKVFIQKLEQAHDAGWEKVKHKPWATQKNAFRAPAPDMVVRFLETGEGFTSNKGTFEVQYAQGGTFCHALLDFITFPGCTLLHAIRWSLLLVGRDAGYPWKNDVLIFHRIQLILGRFIKIRKVTYDLREVSAACEAAGMSPNMIGWYYLNSRTPIEQLILKVPEEKLWPHFAERLEMLELAMGLRPPTPDEDGKTRPVDPRLRLKAMSVLAAFPQVPVPFLPPLWEAAFGPVKLDRALAQAALHRVPEKETRITAALGHGQQPVRLHAAKWLEKLKVPSTIPALEAALKKEKSEQVKGALFDALEALGAPLEPYLDRKKLAEEAAKGVAKGIPKELEWFPWAQMPALRWDDTRKSISPEIITWFLIQAGKIKECVPSPLLKRYASFFEKSQREALGHFIVEAWIAHDTRPAYTPEEAAAKAEAATQKMTADVLAHQAQHPGYVSAYSEQTFYKSVLKTLLETCQGSAQDSKGLLAVAAACAGSDVVPLVQRYLKKWYGYRMNQGKALIQMLSAIEQPAAMQCLLSVGNRFRTKGIQEEATRLCQELAERKGWTLNELADRTIPTAGLDEKGEMELSYGTRRFTARLNQASEIIVLDPDGREITRLPEPTKADDETLAKESKQRLIAARKELKGILKLQQERLYEAMCTQRTWPFRDWDIYLNRHIVVGTHAQGLVWSAVGKGVVTKLFRPLADGSLTDEQDNVVTLPADAVIRLAHAASVTESQGAAWITQLSDYSIIPLFAQFARPRYELRPDQSEETEIKDFEGHLVQAFRLRGHLTRLGYQRGAAQDGGWWHIYQKRFPGLGLEAQIFFSGSTLPEYDHTVALLSLSFKRVGEAGEVDDEGVPLGELPLVLLTECWNDLRLAAAEGSGYDAEWEKKV